MLLEESVCYDQCIFLAKLYYIVFALLHSVLQCQICLLLQVFLDFLLLHSSPLSVGGYPMSKVRGRSREDPMPKRRRPRGVTPRPRSGALARRSYPTSESRGSGWEELPHGRGQGWGPGGATPPPRSGGWLAGAGVPRRVIPHSRSEGAAVRRYPSSKIRSSGCALLEQP